MEEKVCSICFEEAQVLVIHPLTGEKDICMCEDCYDQLIEQSSLDIES